MTRVLPRVHDLVLAEAALEPLPDSGEEPRLRDHPARLDRDLVAAVHHLVPAPTDHLRRALRPPVVHRLAVHALVIRGRASRDELTADGATIHGSLLVWVRHPVYTSKVLKEVYTIMIILSSPPSA